jgi:hypothetical protein
MKVRCSQIGKIMTNPRKSGEVLSQTAKTYVQDLVLEEKYGIRKEFSSRYTDKGNEVEDLSIALVNEVLNYKFIYKNDEHFNNEWLTGTPDVNTDEVLIDVKSSWDASTFPFFETEIPNKDYFYQLQGYMWLTGKTESVLAYCLIDTPLEMVEDEVRRAHWKLHLIDENTELRNEIESKHKFSHIPNIRRVKYWFIQRDEQVIEAIKERVELCREYYNLLMKAI